MWLRVSCLVATMMVAGCSGQRPPSPTSKRTIVHRVRAGETLYGIGRRYGVRYMDIARVNRLKNPSRIQVGQRLLIPNPKRRQSRPLRPRRVAPLPGHAAARKSVARRKQSLSRHHAGPRFAWPVEGGRVTSGFGPRRGVPHDGVDIAAPVGTTVRAAADGEVAYRGNLPGYGNVIILRHAGGYATVYAHNQRNEVTQGMKVRRGRRIATLGRSGRTSGPNLHFEIRKDNAALDPLARLPRR